MSYFRKTVKHIAIEKRPTKRFTTRSTPYCKPRATKPWMTWQRMTRQARQGGSMKGRWQALVGAVQGSCAELARASLSRLHRSGGKLGANKRASRAKYNRTNYNNAPSSRSPARRTHMRASHRGGCSSCWPGRSRGAALWWLPGSDLGAAGKLPGRYTLTLRAVVLRWVAKGKLYAHAKHPVRPSSGAKKPVGAFSIRATAHLCSS